MPAIRIPCPECGRHIKPKGMEQHAREMHGETPRKKHNPAADGEGHLILQRLPMEAIRIGDDILITVVEVRPGDKVRFSIKAPRSVSVHREEVYQEIRAAQQTGPDRGNAKKDSDAP